MANLLEYLSSGALHRVIDGEMLVRSLLFNYGTFDCMINS